MPAMRAPATPFFRDLRMPRQAMDAHSHERFLLDTLAERRAVESRSARGWLRSLAARAIRL